MWILIILMEEGNFLIPWWIGSMWSTNYWVDHPLLILLIGVLIHGSWMIMIIFYILGIHNKIISFDRSHIVVHLQFLGNSDFCNPIKLISCVLFKIPNFIIRLIIYCELIQYIILCPPLDTHSCVLILFTIIEDSVS